MACSTLAVIATLVACSKQKQETAKLDSTASEAAASMTAKEYRVMGEYVNSQDSLPRLRYYDDGRVSLNDRCAVRKTKLNPKMPPIYVNGRPIGFC